jgi:nucleoid-associated protein YgaU
VSASKRPTFVALPTSCRNHIPPQPLSQKEKTMADRFAELKAKYQSVLNFIQQQQNTQLQNVNMEGDKLLIRANAPSQDVKNKIWDQIKLVDPNSPDLIADIQAPAAAAAAAAAGGAPTSGARKYTVKPGDSLSKISQEFYGNANHFMKIFEANKDKLPDPDKVRAGMELVIP